VALAKAPLNRIIGLINGVIGGLNKVKLPDWVPGIGGKGVNIPLIPKLAKGTNYWQGGIAQVHEKGGEILDLPRGSRVYPHDKSIQMAREQGRSETTNKASVLVTGNTFNVREESDIDKIANVIVGKLMKVSVNTP
jgi:phage-related protein